jgi:hypothetical protein
MNKVKRGRPGIIESFRNAVNDKNVFPHLETIAQKAVKDNDGLIQTSVIMNAIAQETGVQTSAVVFKKMVKRYGSSYRLKSDTVLRQMLKIGSGAPKGTCEGIARNPWGRAGKPVEA